MGYDDRDYYRDRPRFELSNAMGRGTLTLLIIVAAGYFTAVVLGNTLSFADPRWLGEAMLGSDSSNARVAYAGFVLTGQNVAPWARGFDPQPWKVLTSWLVEPSLFSMVLALIVAYFIGRAMETLVGMRRLLLSVFVLSAVSALLAALLDPLILPSRVSVIMGIHAALLGLMTPLCWLYPKDQLIMSFPARKFMAALIVILLAVNILLSIGTTETVILSPTQPTFAVLCAAGFTQFLKVRGRLPNIGGEQDDRASWGKPQWDGGGDIDDGERRGSFFLKSTSDESKNEKNWDKEQREEAEERKRVDAILEKISKSGMDSLSRSERKVLDNHSKKMKK